MMDLSFFLFITCTLHSVFGFAPTHTQYSRGGAASAPLLTKEKWSQPLQMSNIFDEMGKFFNGIGKNEVYKPNFDLPEVEDIDGEYVGSKRIITIPAKTMKIGGLRLYCNLYLMGLQNTPEPGCWKAHQEHDTEVNLRYRDMSGCIIIMFKEDEITVDRLGTTPSMKYLLHESIVLNGFLDQLDAIVFEGDVSEGNRLLTLPEPRDQILKARDVLSFS